MNVSQRGLDLIKDFESYLKPLPDGRCTTYLCPAGVATIGWGCTKGVKVGDVWTREEAEDGLRRELAKSEAAVSRLVTVEITQPQFDALVSFAYNCGDGAIASSSILRKLNKGDIDGAASAFSAWNKATVRGRKIVLRGLSRRRAAEKALFLSTPNEEPNDPMPQKVEPPPVVSPTQVAVGGGAIAGAGVLAPEAISQLAPLSANLVSVKGNAGQLLSGVSLTTWLVPILILLLAAGALYIASRKASS